MNDLALVPPSSFSNLSGMKVGVVTVTYQSSAFIPAFLQSLCAQSHENFLLYVIDNASRDDSADLIRQSTDHRVRLIANGENVGVAKGNNQGIQAALEDGCELVLLLNNDTTFDSKLLEKLIRAYATHPWGAVVPKIIFNTPPNTIWYGGGHFQWRRGYSGEHWGMYKADSGQFDAPCTADYSPTCCMLVPRSTLEKVGLMDESFFVYFDDTDFCWRIRQSNLLIGYWPEATLVHHVGGSTGGDASPFSIFHVARNRMYFLKKHFSPLLVSIWHLIFNIYYRYQFRIRRPNKCLYHAAISGLNEYKIMKPQIPTIAESP